MTDPLLSLVTTLLALALLFGVAAMAVMLWMRWWAKEEQGPWYVLMDADPPEAYLTFADAGSWSWTTLPFKAERFPRKHDAQEWARVVGGEVMAESEVGK